MVNNSNELLSDPDDSVEADSLVGGDVPCLDEQDTPNQTMYSRRDFLKIGAVMGGSLVAAGVDALFPPHAEAQDKTYSSGAEEWVYASLRAGSAITVAEFRAHAERLALTPFQVQAGVQFVEGYIHNARAVPALIKGSNRTGNWGKYVVQEEWETIYGLARRTFTAVEDVLTANGFRYRQTYTNLGEGTEIQLQYLLPKNWYW